LLSINSIKKEIKVIKTLKKIIINSELKTMKNFFKITTFGSLIISVPLLYINFNFAVLIFILIYSLSILLSLLFSINKNKFKYIELKTYSKIFILNKQEFSEVENLLNKLSNCTKEYIKFNYLSRNKIKELYLINLKKEKIINILNNLEEILKDLNENNKEILKYEVFDFILDNINKKEFNQNKNKLIDLIEREINNEKEIKLLERMNNLKLKYDDEEINKYRKQLKESIRNNEIPKEKKLIQSI